MNEKENKAVYPHCLIIATLEKIQCIFFQLEIKLSNENLETK